MKRFKIILLLHLLLMVYSASGIFMKLASRQVFLSAEFLLYYFFVFVLLGLYALGWQQIIKRLPLTTAYANHAVSVIWGSVWGAFLFHESLTPLKAVGILLIVCGIVFFTYAGEGDSHE